MAGIYNRDNINYSAMLQNAIANRANAAQRDAGYILKQGDIWSKFATDAGKYLGRGIFATADSIDEDEAELRALEEARQKEINELSEYEANKYNDRFMNADRSPIVTSRPILQDPNEQLAYSNQQDAYKRYMDSIYDKANNDTGKQEAFDAYIDATYGNPYYRHPEFKWGR